MPSVGAASLAAMKAIQARVACSRALQIRAAPRMAHLHPMRLFADLRSPQIARQNDIHRHNGKRRKDHDEGPDHQCPGAPPAQRTERARHVERPVRRRSPGSPKSAAACRSDAEYHTGFRAFSRNVLVKLPLLENSDDFVFDNEMLTQCICAGFHIGELSCPTRYFAEASSINFRRSVIYGIGVLSTTLKGALQKRGGAHFRLFSPVGRKLELDYYHAAAEERT